MYNYSANTQYIGKQFLYLTTCHSTNDLAKTLNSSGLCKSGMVIFAENQTKGRGQQGTSWVSEPGQNLTFSIVLRLSQLPLASQFLFNKALSIHLLGFFRTYFSNPPDTFHIKWPNDVYLNGKKIAGLLLENSLSRGYISSSVVGIGLNVNQQTFEFPTASSLSIAFHRTIDRYELLNSLLQYLDENLSLNFESLNTAEIQTIHKVYDATLWGLHQQRWYQAAADPFIATLKGVDEQGLLILETNEGIERFEIKSVQFLNHPVD
ncbi:MAG: biotin--[acetyl-CoA-carboxylase] ligase [Chitinophagaceae bacterium]|nr:biotin--[acetyl-CoA-carboxylase] ligase [Chitinophagaceae bacterium]